MGSPSAIGSEFKPWLLALLLLALGVYFIACAADGIHAYFTLDDAGNLLHMHRYWEHSLGDEVLSAAQVVTPAYRPLGGMYYFLLYRLAGYNPVPFRAVCLLLMLANVYLAFWLARLLSGSDVAALAAAAFFAGHPAMLSLFYSSGTIYEILCFLFYFLATGCYFRWRTETGNLTWRQLVLLAVLMGCALDAKEMAVTLPAALLLVELLFFPAGKRSWRGPLITGVLAAATFAVKVVTRNPLSNDPALFSYSLHRTLENLRGYQSFLLNRDLYDVRLSLAKVLILWAAMALAAWLFRSRAMGWGIGFFIVSLLPFLSIGRRAGYLLYLPLMGWALWGGAAFSRICGFLIGATRLRNAPAMAARVLLLAALWIPMAHLHASMLQHWIPPTRQDQEQNRRMIGRLLAVHPRLPRGTSVLMMDDPLEPGFEFLFLARLAYGDPALTLDRAKMMDRPPDTGKYRYVLAGGWDLRELKSRD